MTCVRAGCGGQILDGYCDVCWLAPVSTAAIGRPVGETVERVDHAWAEPVSAEPVSAEPVPHGATTKIGSDPRSGTAATERHRLGLGLVEFPNVNAAGPWTAVLADPQVPETRRHCSNCHEPVGRSRGGMPGRTNGFCAKCGTAFNFEPKLGGR